jgi:hypothetical protein
MLGELLRFPLLTKSGTVMVQLGQCFRPNFITKKIFSFQSASGCGTWVLTVDNAVELSFRELSLAVDVAMGHVGIDSLDELEVA